MCLLGCQNIEPPPEQTVILISLDGFRWDYQEYSDTPNLDWVAATGVRAVSLIPVFPSATLPSHFSIATGRFPETHGITGNVMYDPARNDTFNIGAFLESVDESWLESESIWVTAEKHGLISASLFWPGSYLDFQGVKPRYSLNEADRYRVAHADRAQIVLDWLDLPISERPRFIGMYIHHPDTYGHRYGPESDELRSIINEIDSTLGILFKGLETRGISNKINIIIISDHGMISMNAEQVIILDDLVDLSLARPLDHGPVTSFWPSDENIDYLMELLAGKHPMLTMYKREDIPPEWRHNNHPRIAPVVGVAEPGWFITTRPTFEASVREYKGAHGYPPEVPSMAGIFLATGPAFRQGKVVNSFQNIHIYNLICTILAIEPAPNDGNHDIVKTLLY